MPAHSSEQQLEITSCDNNAVFFFNFGGAFVSPKTVKNNIATTVFGLKGTYDVLILL